MRATCRADDMLPFTTARGSLDGGTFEREAPLGARLELSKPWKLGACAFFEVRDDLADDVVQLVGGLGLRNARLFRQTPSEFGLLYSISF